jgi:MYXO-CTERM domain-containing protein
LRSRRYVLTAAAALFLVTGAEALAHFCSNIFSGPAKFVVKTDKSTVIVKAGCPAQLRVYLQNNFPYKLLAVKMQGVASGYTVAVAPAAGQDVAPGQNVGYLFTITGPTGSLPVTTTLSLQIKFDHTYVANPAGTQSFTLGTNDWKVNQAPTQAALISAVSTTFGAGTGQQSPSFSAAKLADLYPSATLSATTPLFGRTGMQQLIQWFGYRYCYDVGGGWNCGVQNCPSPCAESPWSSPTNISQFPQDCMRAGAELAVRKAALGSDLTAAQDGATNALKGAGSGQHKCLAAVVGANLLQGGSTASFTAALTAAGNAVPAICQAAALRVLGSGVASTCSTGNYWERAACAAAEGLVGNDGPVSSVLMASAGDGDFDKIYYSYMLYIVTGARRGTCSSGPLCGTGTVSYYPDAGGPSADGACGPAPDGIKLPDQPKPTPDKPKPAADVTKADQPGAKKDTGAKQDATALADRAPVAERPPQPSTEAGLPADASGGVRADSAGKQDSGCGCAVAAEPERAPLVLLGLLGLALLLGRRRRAG